MPTIHDVLEELGGEIFEPEEDILELIDPSGTQAGGGDSFSADQGEATLVYIFDYRKRRSFTRFMLGFNYADEGKPYRLRRELPQEHPSFPNLWAQTIHFSGAGLSNESDAEPADTPNFPAVYVSNALKKTTSHDKVHATVRFSRRPYTLLEDHAIDSTTYRREVTGAHRRELFRFLYAEPTPQVELLQAEGGVSQLAYSENGPGDVPNLTTPRQAIANSMATLVAKTNYNLMWFSVPESYLADDADELFYPQNVMLRATMVNRVPFLSRKAGTMLMLAPQFQRFAEPVSTLGGIEKFYSYNVRIPVVHFDPPKLRPETGANYPTTPIDNIPRGHRLQPHRASGKWVGAKREDLSHYLLHERDLYDFARHIKDPDGPAQNGDPDPY
jgi:hypothetical protein